MGAEAVPASRQQRTLSGSSVPRAGQLAKAPAGRSLSLDMNVPAQASPRPFAPLRNSSPYSTMQQQGMMGNHSPMANQTNMGSTGMLSGTPPQLGMQQEQWGMARSAPNPMAIMANQLRQQGAVRVQAGPVPMRPSGQPGPRQMLPSQMVRNAPPCLFTQQQAPPNQMAPWSDQMMPMNQHAFGAQGRQFRAPLENVPCLSEPPDEGTLLNQLYSALKDFDGLEEIDRALGIPTMTQPGEQDQFSTQSPSNKPPVYSQQYATPSAMAQGGQTSVQDPAFHTTAGPMGPRPGYPMLHPHPQTRPGVRPPGATPSQPNTLRLQLQHRLQTQQNRQPIMNQMGGVPNMNLPLRPNMPNQGAMNSQMLAQRQRELLSTHLRQCQLEQAQQQRSMMMRAQGVGLMPAVGGASGGVPGVTTSPRVGQQSPQHVPYTPNYGTGLASPQPPTSPFSPTSPGLPAPQLLSHSSAHMSPAAQGMMGNVGGGQFGAQMQHSAFQFPSSGMTQQPDMAFTGATSPQSPLMSPRQSHTQSQMMQQPQAGPAFQPSPDMNGWMQGHMGGSSMPTQQPSPQFVHQPNGGMYNPSHNMNMNANMSVNVNMSAIASPSSMNNLNQRSGQMGVSSANSVPTSGSMGNEQKYC